MNTHVEHIFLFFDREVPLLVQGVSLMTHLYAKKSSDNRSKRVV